MKLPAHGRSLFDARSAGRHPDRAVVIYGDDWRYEGEHPHVAVKPGEYARHRYDWRILAGLPVDVVDRSAYCRAESDQEQIIDGCWAFYWLAAEVARWACPVRLLVPEWGEASRLGLDQIDAVALGLKQGPQSPPWWPEEIKQDYGRRYEAWLDIWREHIGQQWQEAGGGVVRRGVLEMEGARR